MTFSLVARCAETGQVGVAVSSSSPAVAARCAHSRAGVGAVASQNVTDPALGAAVLDAIAAGRSAAEAVPVVMSSAPFAEMRQILAVDATGRTGLHSGAGALGLAAMAEGKDVAAGGNLLASSEIPAAMAAAFAARSGTLARRLLAGLEAGLSAGGEAGPVRSAGLQVADRLSWPFIDLRVDWEEPGCPIAALGRLLDLYEPQAEDYVRRAEAPEAAPSFGVPGDP